MFVNDLEGWLWLASYKGGKKLEHADLQVTQEQLNKYRERGYKNEDILPKTAEKRDTSALNYFTLWMGSIHNIPNYAAVVGYLLLGLSPLNVIIGLTLSGLAVALFMVLNGRAGAKYGIPFAMHLRSTYGDIGAKLPGFLRGCVAAIAWFGVQTYTGAAALTILIGKIWPGFLNIGDGAIILGISVPVLISFLVFWLANVAIGLGGGGILNKFTAILSPIIYVVFGGMTIWAINVGGGIGNILTHSMPGVSSINPIFGYLIIIASVLGVWAAPGVSVSDFTQNAKSQKDQTIGQIGSLFVGYLIFAFMAVIIIIGGTIHFNAAPTSGNGVLDFINQWDSLPAIILTTSVFLMTTISTNATGNILPAGYQLAALFPKSIDYRKGVWIASIVSVLIMPWRFMADGSAIISFLNIIGALLGPVAGVMIAHYFFVNNRKIILDDLYYDEANAKTDSIYKGINHKAYIATIAGLVISLLGQIIPSLSIISDIAWIAGFAVAFVIYYVLAKAGSKDSTVGVIK